MRTSERKLFEMENEIRPNRYVALALTVLSFFIIGMLLANEIGIFRVARERMRIGVFISLVVLEIPIFVSGTESGLRNYRTKYLMICCAGIVTAILCTFLNFHATLALFNPMLMAAQYPSRKMSRIAVVFSMLCAFLCPVISFLTGMWDMDFIKCLYQISGQTIFDAATAQQMSTRMAVAQIILYLSIPHALIILALYPMTSAIGHSGEIRLKNQIQVLHMSESDALTGLLNRLSYEKLISSDISGKDGNVAIIYVDANHLHRINNEQGHAAGDRLLICVADNLRDRFGNESVYRIGGDEFIAVVYGLTLAQVRERTDAARRKIEQRGYSVSVGIEYAQLPCSLLALITSAESKMMIDKKYYHSER